MFDTLHLNELDPIEINDGEFLTDIFKREKYKSDSIPTNCILNKTLPGLGATYCEIAARRNSIIIEPNVPVIKGKVDQSNRKPSKEKKELLGVYEGIKKNAIKKYLLNKKIEHKKILCTPESYIRVKNIAEYCGIDLYKDYFCLYDECEKITQDIDYREQISLPMNDFFQYENKAFVSATPLLLRNPQFEEQNFSILKIKPLFEYRKKLNLITTNHYGFSLINLLDELKDSPCICIFMNSTNGINRLINHIDEKKITDYKVFSSKKSEKKFKSKDIHKSFDDLDLPLAKYNFFTSRFYSAVDIYTTESPDIIILTDLHEALHSKIDPFTNTIQIYGRFRTKHADGLRFNSLTHISNYGVIGNVLSDLEIESYINTSKEIYDLIKEKTEKAIDKGEKKALEDTLDTCSYNKFLDKDGELNYFKIDNFFNDERVRRYYQDPESLLNAYKETGHFDVTYKSPLYIVGDKELLTYKKLPSGIEQRKFLVKKLDTIHSSNNYSPQEILSVEADFLQTDKREQLEEAQFIIEAYNKLGKSKIESVNYYRHEIEKLLDRHEKETNEQKMFSKAVRDELLKRIPENNEIEEGELFRHFNEVFQKYGITHKVNFATVEKYYGADKCKGKDKKGFIKLWKFAPNKEYG